MRRIHQTLQTLQILQISQIFGLMCIIGLLSAGAAAGQGRASVLAGFFPYQDGFPQVEGISPGMTLDSSSAQLAKDVLPAEILRYVEAGDFSVAIRETTDTPLRQAFIDATVQHAAGVTLGEGTLGNYVAGRPFPVVEVGDPQAGLKMAWNHRYRDQGETALMWASNGLRNSSGTVEREQRFLFSFKYGMHRPASDENVAPWQKQGVFSKQYTMMVAPSDSEGNQILSILYDDDRLPNDQWAYDPKTRRTRKIVYNPYVSPGKGVVLIEDRSGFLGYIHDYDWTYLGRRVVLTPGPIKAAEPTWGGRGTWYLTDPWELRHADVLEMTPKNSHPLYSRRLLYLDVQTSVPLFALAYDHDGNHKRTFLLVYRHPDYNPWDNTEWFPQTAAQASIDYQLEMSNTFQIFKIFHNRPMSDTQFSVMTLMLKGK